MKVKVVTPFVVGHGKPDAQAGEVRDLDEDLARLVIARGQAVPAEDEEAKSKKSK